MTCSIFLSYELYDGDYQHPQQNGPNISSNNHAKGTSMLARNRHPKASCSASTEIVSIAAAFTRRLATSAPTSAARLQIGNSARDSTSGGIGPVAAIAVWIRWQIELLFPRFAVPKLRCDSFGSVPLRAAWTFAAFLFLTCESGASIGTADPISPTNGATGIFPNSLLTWAPNSSAQFYIVEAAYSESYIYSGLAVADGATGIVKTVSNDNPWSSVTSYSLPTLNPGMTVYWAVVPKEGGSYGTAGISQFTVTPYNLETLTPNNPTPAVGQTTGTSPLFWCATTGGVQTTITIKAADGSVSTYPVASFPFIPPQPLSAGPTNWNVTIYDPAGNTITGPTWSFTTSLTPPSTTPPSNPPDPGLGALGDPTTIRPLTINIPTLPGVSVTVSGLGIDTPVTLTQSGAVAVHATGEVILTLFSSSPNVFPVGIVGSSSGFGSKVGVVMDKPVMSVAARFTTNDPRANLANSVRFPVPSIDTTDYFQNISSLPGDNDLFVLNEVRNPGSSSGHGGAPPPIQETGLAGMRFESLVDPLTQGLNSAAYIQTRAIIFHQESNPSYPTGGNLLMARVPQQPLTWAIGTTPPTINGSSNMPYAPTYAPFATTGFYASDQNGNLPTPAAGEEWFDFSPALLELGVPGQNMGVVVFANVPASNPTDYIAASLGGPLSTTPGSQPEYFLSWVELQSSQPVVPPTVPPPWTPGQSAPTITTEPITPQIVYQGTAFSLTVAATGTGTLSYQWFLNGNAINGATSPMYAVSSASPGDAGNYDCVVTNGTTPATSNTALITVTAPLSASPGLVQNLLPDVIAAVGGEIDLHWQFSNATTETLYRDGTAAKTWTAPTAMPTSWSITPVTAGDGGGYWVEAKNSGGTSDTIHCLVTVDTTDCSVIVSASPRDGGTVSVSGTGIYAPGTNVTVTATPASGYVFSGWSSGGVPISPNPNYTFSVVDNIAFIANFTTNAALAPTISSVSPTSMPASSALQPVKVLGSNFQPTGVHLLFTDTIGQVWDSANHPDRVGTVTATEYDYQIDNNGAVGTWQVQVKNPDGQTSSNVPFTVTAAASLSGFVRDSKSVQPLVGVTVSLGTVSTTTNSTGYYSFTGLAVGTYTLSENLAGYIASTPVNLSLPAGPTAKDISLVANLAASPTATLSGTVSDATGAPRAGITVTVGNITLVSTNSPQYYSASALTNSSGYYSFPSFPSGQYTVSVTSPPSGYLAYNKTFTIIGATPLNIQLQTNPSTYGVATPSPMGGDPVNTATGNYVYSHIDLKLPGPGMAFTFERNYNSQGGADGPFGFGWNHSYDPNITVNGGYVTIQWGDSKTDIYVPDGSGGLVAQPGLGIFDSLVANPDGTYTLRKKDQTTYSFDSSGHLISIVDKNNNTIALTYTGGVCQRSLTPPAGLSASHRTRITTSPKLSILPVVRFSTPMTRTVILFRAPIQTATRPRTRMMLITRF